jgi:hypothetical protein
VPSGQPTPGDHARAQAILDRLELPNGCYPSYKRAALAFIKSAQTRSNVIRLGSAVAPAARPRLRASSLFGRAYLVCDVPRSWMATAMPGCEGRNSSQSPTLAPTGPASTPRPDRTRVEMQSIIEHEFVHIHQILLGRFHGPRPTSNTLEAMRREFFRSIRNEYEANLLQLTRWPHLWRGIQCEALPVLRRTVERNPTAPGPQLALGRAYLQAATSPRPFRSSRRSSPTIATGACTCNSRAYASLGKRDKSAELLEQSQALQHAAEESGNAAPQRTTRRRNRRHE